MLDTRSLKIRLLLIAAATIGMTLLVAALSLSVIFERHIERRLGEELAIQWNDLAGSVGIDDKGKLVISEQLNDPRYSEPASGAYWQVDGPDGQSLRSRSLWDQVLDIPKTAPVGEPFEINGFDQGSVFYVIARNVVFKSDTGPVTARLMVAIDHQDIQTLSDAFSWDLIPAMLWIGLALFIGAFVQASLGLAPLEALRNKVGAIRTGATQRMGTGFPSEVQPLAEDLDRLLDRQDSLVTKARDRAGALAHGFKTPLTILTLEARKLQENGDSDSAATLREQIEAMRRHVERELARARVRGQASGNGALGSGKSIAPGKVADQLIGLISRMPYADQLSFINEIPADLLIAVDRDDFGEILGNLLDNARKFAKSEVTLTAMRDGDRVTIEVSDDGPGFGSNNGRNTDGSGLGLNIVEDILAEYGGTLTKERRDERTILAVTLGGVASEESLLAAE